MRRMQITSGSAVGTLAALLAMSLLLPCAEIPVPISSLDWRYETISVWKAFFINHVFPHAVYLASIPLVSACLLLTGRSARTAASRSFGGTAFVLLPNVPVPHLWPGALGILHLGFAFQGVPIAPTVYRFGYYLFVGLIVMLGLGFLIRGIALIRGLRAASAPDQAYRNGGANAAPGRCSAGSWPSLPLATIRSFVLIFVVLYLLILGAGVYSITLPVPGRGPLPDDFIREEQLESRIFDLIIFPAKWLGGAALFIAPALWAIGPSLGLAWFWRMRFTSRARLPSATGTTST